MTETLIQLRASLLAQSEMGFPEVIFDEPWSPTPASTRLARPTPASSPAPNPAPPPITTPRTPPAPPVTAPSHSESQGGFSLAKLMAQTDMPSAQPLQDSSWEQAATLTDFFEKLLKHPFYQDACDGHLVPGQGPTDAPFMLVFFAPSAADLMEQTVVSGASGELLTRLLASLKVDRAQCYSTYFHKGLAASRLMPRHVALLRKMLVAEIQIARPQRILFFGKECHEYLLNGQNNFLQEAGAPIEFSGVPATVLIDPQDMLQNVENKKLTWNHHIPRCGFFNR